MRRFRVHIFLQTGFIGVMVPICAAQRSEGLLWGPVRVVTTHPPRL